MFFEKLRGGLAKTRDRLTAGLKSLLTIGRKVDADFLDELEAIFVGADVGLPATMAIIGDIQQKYRDRTISSPDEITAYLKEDLCAALTQRPVELACADRGPTVIMVCGVNGAGKTASIAKLANFLKQGGASVLLSASDTFRAAAIDQLSVWGERVGVDIIKHQMGADPAAVAYDACQAAAARGADYLIVDTAGRLHTQKNLMQELAKIERVIGKVVPGAPHEVLLVLDATTGQNAIQQARVFSEFVRVSGLFLAKLDGTAKGGIVIPIVHDVETPVKFIGVGESVDDIEVFDARAFVEALFQ